jgi:hypothetical protein
MGSRLVYDVATALADAGHPVLRFDFRGVNRSEGAYAQGVGELDDAVACYDELVRRAGQQAVVVGYSFGAGVALRLAQKRPVVRLVTIGLPLPVLDSGLVPETEAPSVVCRVDMVLGDKDPYVTVDAARWLATKFPSPANVIVLPGAAHFLEPSHNARVAHVLLTALAS